MSYELIIKCREKLNGEPISQMERRFGIPKNTLHNVKKGYCNLPGKHKSKLLSFLFDEEKKKIDNWDKLSAPIVCKHKFPKWFLNLRNFCKQENITVDELIDGYKKYKLISK